MGLKLNFICDPAKDCGPIQIRRCKNEPYTGIFNIAEHNVALHLYLCDSQSGRPFMTAYTYEIQDRIGHQGYLAVQLRLTSHQWGLRFVLAL